MRFAPVALLLCIAAPAWAGVGEIIINTETTGGVAFISPAGTSPPLVEQGTQVRVQVLDVGELPIASYPFQDIWIGSFIRGEIALCFEGGTANANTDSEGWTSITGAIAGGGFTTGGTMVFVGGVPADNDTPLPLEFVSPDFNGDLIVDLVDFSSFGRHFGTTDRRSDLHFDGVVDLADFAVFGVHFGNHCP